MHGGPLLTLKVHSALQAAARDGVATVACSLDLDRSTDTVEIGASAWTWQGRSFPYLEPARNDDCYSTGRRLSPRRDSHIADQARPDRLGSADVRDRRIKMLPTAHVSPYADAQRKVALVHPRDKVILDTCGGLGYFASCCLAGGARQVASYEKSADVMWLRSLNPWSPENSGDADDRLSLTRGDIVMLSRCYPTDRSMQCCTIHRASALQESCTQQRSINSWRECSDARACSFTTPDRRTR